MIEQAATVVKTADNIAWVESQRQSTCGSCSAKKGCGTSLLDNMFGASRIRVKVRDDIGTHQGDDVIIAIEENALVASSLLMYIVPVVGLFLFAGIADLLLHLPELFIIISGLTGIIGGFYVVRKIAALSVIFSSTQPAIIEVVKPDNFHAVTLRRGE